MFKPGSYNVEVPVGYYTQLAEHYESHRIASGCMKSNPPYNSRNEGSCQFSSTPVFQLQNELFPLMSVPCTEASSRFGDASNGGDFHIEQRGVLPGALGQHV